MSQRKLAIVTGASSGIGLEIAKLAAQDGFDLIVAADTPFVEAGPALEEYDVEVQQVEADLATKQGVDQLLQLVGDRQVAMPVTDAARPAPEVSSAPLAMASATASSTRARTSGCMS